MRKLRSKWPWKVNLPIGTYHNPFIDRTFRWKRDFDSVFTNLIFFRCKNRQLKVILAKESMKKLKKQGWIN